MNDVSLQMYSRPRVDSVTIILPMPICCKSDDLLQEMVRSIVVDHSVNKNLISADESDPSFFEDLKVSESLT